MSAYALTFGLDDKQRSNSIGFSRVKLAMKLPGQLIAFAALACTRGSLV